MDATWPQNMQGIMCRRHLANFADIFPLRHLNQAYHVGASSMLPIGNTYSMAMG